MTARMPRRVVALAGALLGLAFGATVRADEVAYGFESLAKLDCAAANRKLNEGVAAGSAEAAYTIAKMVGRGICFQASTDAYVQLLRKAVDAGHEKAAADLAYSHGRGIGVAQDYSEAGRLLHAIKADPGRVYDDYTLGYLSTIVRLVWGRTRMPAWTWSKDQTARISVSFDPTNFAAIVDVTHDPARTTPADAEADKFLVVLREAVGEAFKRARAMARTPDTSRLQGPMYEAAWSYRLRTEQSGPEAWTDDSFNAPTFKSK
jgi:hypothetical protein